MRGFQPRYKRVDLFDWKVPLSGVEYSVELEWRLAARWAGYRFDEFQILDGEEQSENVAAYRIAMRIEAVLNMEQARAAKARSTHTTPRSSRAPKRRR